MAMMARDSASEVDMLLKTVRLFLGATNGWLKNDMIELLRAASIAHSNKNIIVKSQKSLSNELEAVRDVLRDDPHNMMAIVKLGFMYAAEYRWSMSMNVLLRGWKRVSEFTDPRLRVAFLTKLAESCYMEGKVRQAAAVLHDMDSEPEGRDESKSYQLLMIHVHAANKDIGKALQLLAASIEGEDTELVVRMWALCSQAMLMAGMFDAAKAVVDGVVGPLSPRGDMQTVAAMDTVLHYSNQMKRAQEESQNMTFMEKMEKNPEFAFKTFMGAGLAVSVLTLTWFLYWLEQRSLAGMRLGH